MKYTEKDMEDGIDGVMRLLKRKRRQPLEAITRKEKNRIILKKQQEKERWIADIGKLKNYQKEKEEVRQPLAPRSQKLQRTIAQRRHPRAPPAPKKRLGEEPKTARSQRQQGTLKKKTPIPREK
jgi:bifunctional DNA-binding transcriptional regulator/antitoxin component of YhaV-PrlF toxin-antitoxin module